MKKILFGFLLPASYGLFPSFSFSQPCNTLSITHEADIASTCNFAVMTMMHDELNRPYLYVANKEGGLKVYDISVIATPTLAATVPVTSFNLLDVMNVSQNGNYLYLAIGNHFNSNQASGMAIVDVTNPALPAVTDYWELSSSGGGSGIVKVEGNYAYLGAMQNGLIILDITNKSNIIFVSQFFPDINWPVNNPTASLYNSRGMEVKNSIVYLCFDAGGLRIINCTNKSLPVETGRFANPALYQPLNLPRAYNNIVLDDSLAYVTVDYCGLEILNISDTSNITLTGWWNPYNCPNNNWFSSPVHANEIQYDKDCKQVFLSTGKSDMMAVDVSDPTQPDSCNFYGGVSNNIGTWGVGLYQNQIYLSYICTLGIPFASGWTGVKLLTYSSCTVGLEEQGVDAITVFPVPARDKIIIESVHNLSDIKMSNMLGQISNIAFQKSGNKFEADISGLPQGCYFLKLRGNGQEFTKKIMKG